MPRKANTAKQIKSRREYQRRYYWDHREHAKEYQRQYNLTHKKKSWPIGNTGNARGPKIIPRKRRSSAISKYDLGRLRGQRFVQVVNEIMAGRVALR